MVVLEIVKHGRIEAGHFGSNEELSGALSLLLEQRFVERVLVEHSHWSVSARTDATKVEMESPKVHFFDSS